MRDEVKTQSEAWRAYDLLRLDPRVEYYPEEEPDRIETELRSLTRTEGFAPQRWPDAYVAAFARVGGLTVVTFDRALCTLAGDDAVLLGPASHS